MPKRNRLILGFIDPISIIGGLFLLVTLVATAVIVKNKNFSLNINEKAAGSCMTTCMKEVGDSAECSFVCKADKPAVAVKPPEPVKPVEKTPEDKLEKEEIQNLQQVITAPVVINGNVVNPATSVPVTQGGGAAVSNPVTTNDSGNTPPVVGPLKECTGSNAVYPLNAVVVGGASGQSNGYAKCTSNGWVADCDDNPNSVRLCTITDIDPSLAAVPIYLQPQYQEAINQQAAVTNANSFYQLEDAEVQRIQAVNATEAKSQAAIAVINQQQSQNSQPNNPFAHMVGGSGGTTEVSGNFWTNLFNGGASTSNSSYNPCPAGSKYIDHTCVINPENIASAESLIANLNNQRDNQQTAPNYPIYNFSDCNRDGLSDSETAECNKKFSQVYNMPIIGDYLQSYAPQNVQYTGNQFLGYNFYNPTTEQVSSSVRLGGTLTAAAGVAGGVGSAALGYMTLPEMVAAGMATSTVYQTTSATATCIDNPGSKECINEASWAAVSWANVGSSALASTLSTTGAQTFNAVVNVLNIGADAVDINQSCFGENTSTFGCGAAIVGTVFDAGQGVGDLVHALDNTYLGGLDLNVNDLADITISHPSNVNIQVDHYQPIISNLPENEIKNILKSDFPSGPETNMPAFPAGILTDEQADDLKVLETYIREARSSELTSDIKIPTPRDGLPATIYSSNRFVITPSLTVPIFSESLPAIRESIGEIIDSVSIKSGTLDVLFMDGSIGKPTVDTIGTMPIFDSNVPQNALKVEHLGEGIIRITNTSQNTIHDGIWELKPGMSTEVVVGDTIKLSENTIFKITDPSSLTGQITIRDNTTFIEKLTGNTTTANANRVGQENGPVFFHPEDMVVTSNNILPNSPPITKKLPSSKMTVLLDGNIQEKQIVIQIVDSGRKYVLPYDEVNIFPHNSRNYVVEFGTVDNNGEFRILDNIFSTDQKPSTASDLGIINRLEMNMSSNIQRTITHVEPSLISQALENLIKVSPTTPITTRIGDWVDNTVGNNPIINRIIGRPEDIRLRPNEIALDIVNETAQLPYENLAKGITGIGIGDVEMTPRLLDDHYSLKQKYNLPDRGLRFESPNEYIYQLNKIAKDNGIPIRDASEWESFFENHPAGAVFDDVGNQIFVDFRTAIDDPITYGGLLEHELIHALQVKSYPSMPVEVMEYEAYVTANMSLTNVELDPKNVQEAIFNNIEYSVSHWYQEKSLSNPWLEVIQDNTVSLTNHQPTWFQRTIITPSAGFLDGVRNWWQQNVGDLNFRGLGNDQIINPRTADTNNWFDNIIARFDGVAQPSLRCSAIFT